MRLIGDEALAAITIKTEAEGESFEGKVGVAEVIRNRMEQRIASDGTVAGTVARRYQFSAWNDDKGDNELLIRCLKADDTDPLVQDCIKAWLTAQAGSNLAKGATHYFGPKTLEKLGLPWPAWAASMRLVATIGHHQFYV